MEFVFNLDSMSLQGSRAQVRIPAGIRTKKELLEALDVGLGFPDYFGGNWDALWECICDLSWIRPAQVIVVHEDLPMQSDQASLKTYLSILSDAIAYWNDRTEHDLVVAFPRESEATVRTLMSEA